MNTKNELRTKNFVFISGKIISKFLTNKDYLIIRIEANGNRPSVFIPDRSLVQQIHDEYEAGDTISILGNIQSSTITQNGKTKFVNSIFATSVIDIQPLDFSIFALEGYVVGIKKEKIFTKLIIKTYGEHISSVPVVFYNKTPKYFKVGDRISVSGMIQTKLSIDTDGNKNWYQNYVVR